MTIWLKGCPRCRRGDVIEEKDYWGDYLTCVQCGHVLTPREAARLRVECKAFGVED